MIEMGLVCLIVSPMFVLKKEPFRRKEEKRDSIQSDDDDVNCVELKGPVEREERARKYPPLNIPFDVDTGWGVGWENSHKVFSMSLKIVLSASDDNGDV